MLATATVAHCRRRHLRGSGKASTTWTLENPLLLRTYVRKSLQGARRIVLTPYHLQQHTPESFQPKLQVRSWASLNTSEGHGQARRCSASPAEGFGFWGLGTMSGAAGGGSGLFSEAETEPRDSSKGGCCEQLCSSLSLCPGFLMVVLNTMLPYEVLFVSRLRLNVGPRP